jgi:phosphoribosylformylglycinamidine synthase
VSRLDALLFGETQSRVIITTAALDAVKVIERAQLLGIPAVRIGTVGGTDLKIHASADEFSWPVAELHELWWNSIAKEMR